MLLCLSAARFWEWRRSSFAIPRSTEKPGRNPENYQKCRGNICMLQVQQRNVNSSDSTARFIFWIRRDANDATPIRSRRDPAIFLGYAEWTISRTLSRQRLQSLLRWNRRGGASSRAGAKRSRHPCPIVKIAGRRWRDLSARNADKLPSITVAPFATLLSTFSIPS